MSRLAAFLRAIADRLSPESYFDLESEATVADWAGLIVLHAEGVHGCDHTAEARAAIGMYDPETA
jgi:hypothetical protein